ncbi:histidine phosphatase family protein [Schaalia sp. ZJ405]|uniref:histidine phosphatase family protein n=1 Tax=Schaalia sp. ZJ405 TaxID=2709403 RepID=UPI002F2B8560
MMTLVLVRHGQTPANRLGALDTIRPGLPLTPKGQEQARALANRWEREIAAPPSAIALSGLTRTKMTAAPLAQRYGLTPLIRPGVREIRSGDIEMNRGIVSGEHYVEPIARWCRGELDVRMPGGETGREVLARAYPVILEVMEHARRVDPREGVGVVVAHGALLRLLASSLAHNISAEVVIRHFMENTKTVVLQWPVDRVFSHPDDLLGSLTALTWNDAPVEAWD